MQEGLDSWSSFFPISLQGLPDTAPAYTLLPGCWTNDLGSHILEFVSMWIGEDEYQQLKLVLFKNETICPPCMVHHCDFLCGCKNIATLFPTVLPAVLQD